MTKEGKDDSPAGGYRIGHQGMTLPFLRLQVFLIDQVRLQIMTTLPNDNPQRYRHVVNGGVTNRVHIQGEYIGVFHPITFQPMFEQDISSCLIHMDYPPYESSTPLVVNIIVARRIAVVLVRNDVRVEHNHARRIMMG